MHTSRLMRLLSAHVLIAVFVLTTITTIGISVLGSQPKAAAEEFTSANWVVADQATDCTWATGNFTKTVHIELALQFYGSDGSIITLKCSGLQYDNQSLMELGDSSQCSIPEGLVVYAEVGGGAATKEYETATAARISKCFNTGLAWVPLKRTYRQALGDAPIGTGVWTVDQSTNHGKINANYTLGDRKSADTEVFDETAVNGRLMTLTGTKADSHCDPDTLVVGSVKDYLSDTLGTVTTYTYEKAGNTGNDFICVANKGTIRLTKSFQQAGGTGVIADDQTTFECPFDSNGLNYFMCDLFKLARDTVKNLSDVIEGALFVNPDQVFGTPLQNGYNIFRNIALSLIVVAALVMVASQAAGFEIFSAYAIRKALPRLIAAAIGISLAWPIMQFAITFFNDIGIWVNQIMYGVANAIRGPGTTSSLGSDILVLLFGSIGVTSAVIGLGALGLLSLAASVALGLLVAYVTLVVRQIVIVMAVMLAPLAIAASILPGTEKLWKFWRETLLGALVMFPLVMGFLSAGAIFAAVASTQAGKAGTSGGVSVEALNIVAIIAYFIPFFLIPTAFRMAGGLMANLFGTVSDLGKGRFEQLRKYRQQTSAENWAKVRVGARYNDRNLLGRPVNFIGKNVATGFRGGFGLFRRQANQDIALRQGAAAAEATKNPLMQQLALNDDANAYMFASGGGKVSAGVASQRLQNLGWNTNRIADARAAAEAVGINHANWQASVQTLAQNKARSLGASAAARDMVVRTIDDASSSNQDFNNAAGTFGALAGASGATTFSGVKGYQRSNIAAGVPVSLAESWGNSSMNDLANSGDKHLAEFLNDAVARLGSTNATTRYTAAVQLTEAQNLLSSQALGASGQKLINQALINAGYGVGSARAIPATEYFATRVGIAGVNGNVIARRARILQR